MTRYESAFDTEWEQITPDEAAEHAYAIGVAELLGEDNRSHLHRLLEAMDTGYTRGLVELAYQEGRTEAKRQGRDDVWETLVDVDDNVEQSAPVPSRLPRILELCERVRRRDVDSRAMTERPGFLDR